MTDKIFQLLREVLTGNILTREFVKKQRKLLMLIAALIFVYIYFGYLAQRQHRHLAEIQQQIEEASYMQLTINAKLTDITRPSSIAKQLEEHGSNLKQLTKPVILFED